MDVSTFLLGFPTGRLAPLSYSSTWCASNNSSDCMSYVWDENVLNSLVIFDYSDVKIEILDLLPHEG
jgi:hypothetical protein